MGKPSHRELRALGQVMYQAILRARILGWEGMKQASSRAAEEIADLMDAIHNVPPFLTTFEHWDYAWFRRDLDGYDEKWSGESGLRLRMVYDDALADDSPPE